ncbi:MAG: hypothetical protein ROO71_02645 [Balneola sp.]
MNNCELPIKAMGVVWEISAQGRDDNVGQDELLRHRGRRKNNPATSP